MVSRLVVLGLVLNEKDEINFTCGKNKTLCIALLKLDSLCT